MATSSDMQATSRDAIEAPQSREHAVELARGLRPILEAGAMEAERNRHLPTEMVDAFVDAGLIRMGVPERFGGNPLGFRAQAEVIMELGKGYGSMAWVGGFMIGHALFLGHFPEQAQLDVWESTGPDTKIASSFQPVGKVKPVDGGFRVSGQWSWSSGVGHCDWIMLNAFFPLSTGGAAPRWFIVPTDELTIIDTWNSAGLSGTGSDDVVLEDVFVPEHRLADLGLMMEGRSPGRDLYGGMWSRPMMAFGGLEQTAPALGVARGALETWTEYVRGKASTYTQEQVSQSLPMQLALADATVKIDCAEMLLMRALEIADTAVEITLDHRVANRLAITHVPQFALQGVNELMQFAGASALRTDNPIQRAWRDVRACSMHILCNYTASGENYGRRAFGMPLSPTNPVF